MKVFKRSIATITASFALCQMPTLGLANPLDFNFQLDISNEDYRDLVFPIVNPMRYMFLQPASPTGILGFDVGLGVSGTEIPDDALELASTYLQDGDDLPSFVAIPRLTAQKGLPFDIDLALNLSVLPGTDITLIGGALQYAPLDGPFPIPSISVRIGHTQLVGLDALSAQNTNVEAVASFGIPPGISILKPYLGVGSAWASANSSFDVDVQGTSTTITAEAEWQDLYGLFGVQLSLIPFVPITAELQVSEEQTLYSGKISASF